MFEQKMSRRAFLALSVLEAASLSLGRSKAGAVLAATGSNADRPVVVIGAGLGGLSAAAHLTRLGVPVTVIEQHAIPGGYATAFLRGDFTFDVSLHQISLSAGTAAVLKELGILDKLDLVPLPGREDEKSLIERLARDFPAEKDGIAGFIKEITRVADEISDLSTNREKSQRVSVLNYPGIRNIQGKTLADILNAYVKDPELKDRLAYGWGAYGLPPSKLSAFYFAVARGGSLRNGSCYIRPRSQKLSDLIAEAVTSHGGKILYGARAQKIKTGDGAVQGVLLEDGRVLPAVAVVSNASAITTFKNMLSPGVVPDGYLKRLDGLVPSISSFIVWLGLNGDARQTIKSYRQGFRTGRGIEADCGACMKGEAEKVSYSMTVYDHLFDGYSRRGKSTITLLCLSGYEPWRRFEADYRAGRKSDYYKEKKRWTDILISRAQKDMFPGLASMIETKESATPLTNWRFTGNPEGAIYGFNQTVDNAFMNRLDCRTPIKGLYLAGAWATPGGGYGGALSGGEKAFIAMVEDWSR
ncbi:MAG TPA: FAD-dependent oxidoreductase [Syntrophorhabdaceae bacterium]|nr:FAD-dependent oxidoreductase [Syntrophorhabdaceae bacterium]